MSGWLRSLPRVLRGSIYFIGVVLAFVVAFGVGAAAMVVAGWDFGRVATGPGEVSALSSTELETTGPARAPEPTTAESSGDSDNSGDTAFGNSFVHRATDENSSENYTYIDDADINGNANAVILILSAASGDGAGGAPYGHNIGVFYEPGVQRWAIFNQDRAPMQAGAAFEVVIPPESDGFVHRAESLDTVGNATFLNGPDTNDKPDATLSVTQNWNPGGGDGVYNDHPAGVFYDGDVDQWGIYNRDGAPMPEGAAFNVAVSAGEGESAR